MTSSASETDRTRTGRWQFSLSRLLLLFTLAAITLGLASWALSYAAAFLVFSGTLMTLEGLIRGRIGLWGLVFRVALIFMVAAIFSATQRPTLVASTGILAIRVVERATSQPIALANVVLCPNGNTNQSVPATTDQKGECRIAASFAVESREKGWGRLEHWIVFQDTIIQVSAPGYEDSLVYWKDISPEEDRLDDAPPGPSVEIRLLRQSQR